MYEILQKQKLSEYLSNGIRIRWDDEPFPDKWSVSYASTKSDWQWSEPQALSAESSEYTWPYDEMLWNFGLEEIKHLCPPSIIFQRNPDELDCLDDVSSICLGMVRDLDRCLTEDDEGKAAWMGGSLLLFSYIEILGRMFLPEQFVKGPKATEGFIFVYMPKLANAVETTYRESLHVIDQDNVYSRFHNHFRDGLAHQYFQKKGELAIDESATGDHIIIRDNRFAGDMIVFIKPVLGEFKQAVETFLVDVVEKKERTYGESAIDVQKNCAQRLDWWTHQETLRIVETLRKRRVSG